MSNNRTLRIVFMGTPDFAVATLDKLFKNNFEIVGIITAPDRPAGRGRKLQSSAVKQYALENGLKVLQPTNLKDEVFLTELKALNANLQVVVAFRMLPKVVWQMPEYGTFNLHASLLPNYRGAAPINWAIINGEHETGATTFFIDDKIDTGEIILQRDIKIEKEDTAGSLHDKLMMLGADLTLETVQQIAADNVSTQSQKESKDLKAAPKIFKDTCKIDWNASLEEINNHIRGLSPYPTAWTTLYSNEDTIFLKIYLAQIERQKHDHKIGTLVFDKTTLKVAVADGYVNLLEIQIQGKRKMKTKDVLNGLKLSKSAYVL